MKKALYILLGTLILTGCFPFDEGEESKIIGRYYVRGDSRFEHVYIGYEDRQYGGIGLISEPVTAVGHNEDHIIAKRGGTEEENYYLLKVIRNGVHGDAEKATIGPLDKTEFDAKLKELGLCNSLKFEREFIK